jgi:bla regulator protein blaR1
MMSAIGVHLMESTVFALLVSILVFGLQKRGPSARYAVWFAAAAKFAVPAALFSWLGIRLESVLPAHDPGRFSGAVFNALVAPQRPVGAYHHSPILAVITTVWVSGAILMLIVWIRRSLALGGEFDCPADQEHEVLERLRQHLHISRTVGLRASTRGGSELGLWGIWRPTIQIPRGLSSQLTSSELEAVLLHELAHVRRWDNLTATFVHTLVSLFWFHPLLWWIEKRLIVERERACDEMVIHGGVAHQTYVAGILKVCRFQLVEAVAGTSGIAGPDLKNRLELIMSCRISNSPTNAPRTLLCLLVAAMTMVPLLGGFLQQSVVHAQNAAGSQRSPTSAQQGACMFNNVEYARGTVLQMGTSPRASRKECAAGGWASTNQAATAVAEDATAKQLPPPLPPVCRPAPRTSPNQCGCQDGSYSLGAIVNGENGKMRCDKFVLGQYSEWRPATPRDLGVK